mmetsp:Transcript_15309/g.61577  ORF Transcript_15309/g.61577 Transcript_15309/m.61577 type:complete len:332 (+) Transcript_15309:2-997(+)
MSTPVVVTRSAYGAHPAQFVRVHTPTTTASGALGCVVVVHGGFWKNKYTLDNAACGTLAPAIAATGRYVGVEVEYRRRDDAGGGWPGTCDDVVAAVRHAAGFERVDATRVVVIGHSAGGHAALCAAHALAAAHHHHHHREQHRQGVGGSPVGVVVVPALTVAVAPVADLIAAHERRLSDEGDAAMRFLGGATPDQAPDLYRAASPAHSMLPMRAPCLIVTGLRDVDVPPDLTRDFARLARRAAILHGDDDDGPAACKPDYLELEDADHYDLVDSASRSWSILWERIQTLLRVEIPVVASFAGPSVDLDGADDAASSVVDPPATKRHATGTR